MCVFKPSRPKISQLLSLEIHWLTFWELSLSVFIEGRKWRNVRSGYVRMRASTFLKIPSRNFSSIVVTLQRIKKSPPPPGLFPRPLIHSAAASIIYTDDNCCKLVALPSFELFSFLFSNFVFVWLACVCVFLVEAPSFPLLMSSRLKNVPFHQEDKANKQTPLTAASPLPPTPLPPLFSSFFLFILTQARGWNIL